MAGDKKNIPYAGKVDEPPKPGKVEPAKAAPPVQDQPAPTKAEAPVIEDMSKVVMPPMAEPGGISRSTAPSSNGPLKPRRTTGTSWKPMTILRRGTRRTRTKRKATNEIHQQSL